jgi:hypothetical protein
MFDRVLYTRWIACDLVQGKSFRVCVLSFVLLGMRYFLLNTNIPPLAQVRQCMVCYSSRVYYFMHLQVILLLFFLISGEQYFTTVIINLRSVQYVYIAM